MNKRYSYALVYSFLISVATVMHAEMRPIIMLFDWKMEYMGNNLTAAVKNESTVVTLSLINAIKEKAAPILVSGSVWRNFIERRKLYEDLKKEYSQVEAYYKNRFTYFDKNEFDKLRNIVKDIESKKGDIDQIMILCKEKNTNVFLHGLLLSFFAAQVKFDASEWIMKKLTTNGSLYLLVPSNDSEFKKGLNVNSFPDVSDMLNIDSFPSGQTNNLDNDLIPTLNKLFVLNKQDAQAETEWIIWMFGHGKIPGMPDPYIAGIDEKVFKKVLHFFNNRVTTKFLFYITCFSGGERIVRPYQTNYDTRQDIFNYTIATATALYLSVTVSYGSFNSFKEGFDALKIYFNDPEKAESIDTILGYLHKNLNLITNLEVEPLDVYLGKNGNDSYEVPLYLDGEGGLYVKKNDTNCYSFANLYLKEGAVYIDPSTTGAELFNRRVIGLIKLPEYLERTPDDSIFFIDKNTKTKKQVLLILRKNTGFVFLMGPNRYFTWEDPVKYFSRIRGLQVPAIRFPGTEWFSTLDVDKKVQRISRITALTARAENKRLIIGEKEILIFDTQSPIASVMDKASQEHAAIGSLKILSLVPKIMLIAPKNAQLYIESIESTVDFIEILQNFMPLQQYPYERTFYIKKIMFARTGLPEDQNDVIDVGKEPRMEFTDVIILSNASNKRNGVYFTYKGKKFSAVWSASDTNNYTIFKDAKSPQLPKLKQEDYSFTYPYLEDLTEYTKISTVKKAVETKLKQGPEVKMPGELLREKLQGLATALNNLSAALAKT